MPAKDINLSARDHDWPLIAGFFALTASTIATFHFAISYRGEIRHAILAIPSYITLIGIALSVFPRAIDRGDFWRKTGLGATWVGAGIVGVIADRWDFFYLAFAGIIIRTCRECLQMKRSATSFGVVAWVLWVMTGVVYSLLTLPHFEDISRIVFLRELGWYFDIRIILSGLIVVSLLTASIVIGLKDPVPPREIKLRWQLPVTKSQTWLGSVLRRLEESANILFISHVEEFFSLAANLLWMIAGNIWNVAKRIFQFSYEHIVNTDILKEMLKATFVFIVVITLGTFFHTFANGIAPLLTGSGGAFMGLVAALLLLLAPLMLQFLWPRDNQTFLRKAGLGLFYIALMFTSAKWAAFTLGLTNKVPITWGAALDVYMFVIPLALLALAVLHFMTRKNSQAQS